MRRPNTVIDELPSRGALLGIAAVWSDVHMRAYGDLEIAAYVAAGGGRDKAGAYGIQDEPFRPVAAIDWMLVQRHGAAAVDRSRTARRCGVPRPVAPRTGVVRGRASTGAGHAGIGVAGEGASGASGPSARG